MKAVYNMCKQALWAVFWLDSGKEYSHDNDCDSVDGF